MAGKRREREREKKREQDKDYVDVEDVSELLGRE
jgi:hypothetical protein